MRKLNWDDKLSEADIAWIRQAGFVNGEELIAENAKQHGTKVPDAETPEDAATRGTIGEDAVGNPPTPVDPATGAPRRVDPADNGEGSDDEDDDYDEWSMSDLHGEVKARNELADQREDVSRVEVTPTGANNQPKKPDMVSALRAWDKANPGVLED